MPHIRKKLNRTSKQVGLPQTGIPDWAKKSREEQIAVFSEQVMKNPNGTLHRLWSKLDPDAHAFILSELGCFDREDRAKSEEWARKVIAQLKRHAQRLKKFLDRQAEFEDQLIRYHRFLHPSLNFKVPSGRIALKAAVESEIAELNQLVTYMIRLRKPRSSWDPGKIVIAQKYVLRRAANLGTAVRLTPAAIAEVYKLTGHRSNGSNDSDTAENIRKAIARFRDDRKNAQFIENIVPFLQSLENISIGRQIRKLSTPKMNS